jgi:hypothetical protein
MAAPAQVHLRRVYENPDPAGGRRVLVDRLWPRGLARSAAAVDEWLKAVAPRTSCAAGMATSRRNSRRSGSVTSRNCALRAVRFVDHLRQLARGPITR